MSEYEEEVLKYCNTRILPEGYKIDADFSYLSLPRIADIRGGSQLLQKATPIILDSKAIAKESRVNVFEFLRDPDAFHTTGNAIREMAEAADPDEVSIPLFLDDLFESIEKMPE
jgi:hypothetical protein